MIPECIPLPNLSYGPHSISFPCVVPRVVPLVGQLELILRGAMALADSERVVLVALPISTIMCGLVGDGHQTLVICWWG